MKYREWELETHQAIAKAIVNCFSSSRLGGWQENYITTVVLQAIEAVGCELAWEDCEQRVKWEAYKLSGSAETQFGDIALMVKVRLAHDCYIDGVAFYEAKRQYYDKSSGKAIGFTSLRADQLSRLSKATHASQIILYDMDLNDDDRMAFVSAVPTVFAERLADADVVPRTGRLIHRYGVPWVRALGSNLRGFGLDTRPEAVEAIRQAAEFGQAPFAIVNVGVGMIKGLEPELDAYCSQLDRYERWIGHGIEPDVTVPRNDGPGLEP